MTILPCPASSESIHLLSINSSPLTILAGRRQANSRSAVEARAIAAEERMKREKREREAALNQHKVKTEVKDEVKSEEDELYSEEGEAPDDDGGWHYEDPRVKLEAGEEDFLKDEMEHWDDDWLEDDTMVAQGGSAVASGSGSGSKAKSKGKACELVCAHLRILQR